MKKAIIIGASGAVGKAVAFELKNNGVATVLTSSRKNNDGYSLVNLSDKHSIEAFAQTIDTIDYIIIAAGKEPQQNLEGLTWEHFNEMIDIHYKGPLWLIKQLQPKLNEGSCITLMSSVAAYRGSYDPTYSSLKGAISSLAKTLSRELAPKVRVNAIAPGLIQGSPVFNRMSSDFREKHLNSMLTPSFSNPEDVAKAVLFIHKQVNFNGQIIHLNGGQYFGN